MFYLRWSSIDAHWVIFYFAIKYKLHVQRISRKNLAFFYQNRKNTILAGHESCWTPHQCTFVFVVVTQSIGRLSQRRWCWCRCRRYGHRRRHHLEILFVHKLPYAHFNGKKVTISWQSVCVITTFLFLFWNKMNKQCIRVSHTHPACQKQNSDLHIDSIVHSHQSIVV